MDQSELEANTCSAKSGKTRAKKRCENGFASDWLRKWREMFYPIKKRSNAKPMQLQITVDTQLKLALITRLMYDMRPFVLRS